MNTPSRTAAATLSSAIGLATAAIGAGLAVVGLLLIAWRACAPRLTTVLSIFGACLVAALVVFEVVSFSQDFGTNSCWTF